LLEDFENRLRQRDFSPHTIRSYVFVVRSFLNSLLSETFLRNEQATVSAYMDLLMTRRLSRRTVAHHITILREFFKHLHANGVIDRTPIMQLPSRRGYSRPLPRFLTEPEMTRLLDSTKDPRILAMLEFLYASGCRIGELAALRIEDLDFDERVVTLHGKGRKDRQVPFGNKAAEALKNYLQGRTVGPVFQQKRFPGKPISTRSLARFISLATFRAGLGHCNPHAFRHSFATHLLNRGVNLRYIQELLGHAHLATTQVYVYVAIDDLKKTHERCHPRG
jgi:site-specific recombinase XerD